MTLLFDESRLAYLDLAKLVPWAFGIKLAFEYFKVL